MKLKLLDVNKFASGLKPVTTTELRTRSGEPHPDGLFSETIFGIENSLDRSKRFSYMNLNAYIIHPAAYKLLIRIDRRIETFLNTEDTYSLDAQNNLIPDPKGVSGMDEFMKIFDKLNLRGETEQRDKIIKILKDSFKNNVLFINKLPIIPPGFREMYEDKNGNIVMDEINDIYLNILRKASQIKTVGKGSALYNLLNFYLQRAVNEHDQFVRKKISKKSGLIRANMLGKRIDFSARGVITPGPKLKVNEIGVPLRIAVTLFQPFLIHYFLFSKKYPYIKELEAEIKEYTEGELSVDTVTRVIKAIKNNDKIPKKLYDLFFDATEVVMKGRVVLAKRDPALHPGSYRGFYPVLVGGDTIQICTLQVGEYNADFDGDQMGLFHPLSRQAQDEAKEKIMRGVGAKNFKHVNYELSKEMAVGLYTMTKDIRKGNSPIAIDREAMDKANDPYIMVKYKGKVTTMGRAIFNSYLPANHEFVDKVITKKIVNGMIPDIIDKYGEEVAREVFSNLEKVSFKFATIIAPSITIDMLEMPESILRIKEKIPNASPAECDKLLKDAEKIMIEHLKDTGLYELIMSGAGKGWGQPRQILVAKGIITDPKGNLLPPIKGSFADGLTATEYFSASSGARKGMADRALNTATTGYFTRQLVYLLGPAEASANVRDCKTKRTILLRLTNDYIKRLTGRYIVRGDKLVEFNPSQYKPGDVIRLRSPIYCESKKFCHTCYGNLLRRHKTPYVGILAGSTIGERGTQLIMQTFHTGGAAKFAVHDIIQDILDNDPLIQIDLNRYLQVEEDRLVTKKNCKVTIDLENYTMNNNIQINEDHVWCNHLLSKIEFEDVIFNLMLDYPVHVKKMKMKNINKEFLEFNFLVGDTILEVPMATDEIKAQVNYVGRLVGGKVVYKDPSHLITKIMKVYGGGVSDLDLVHFEVLISQVLRDRKNQSLPARLGRVWDPVMMNIKNVVFSSGFVQGLAFENVNKAIEVGLITEEDVEESVLGKLVTGERIN